MTPVLNIDATAPQYTVLGIRDAEDPAGDSFDFVKLTTNPGPASQLGGFGHKLVGPWFAYDKANDRVEALDEQASLPLQLLLMAYFAGYSEAAVNTQAGCFASVQLGAVSHIPNAAYAPHLQQLGQKVLAYHAATQGHPQPSSQQQVASILQMLATMPALLPAGVITAIDVPQEPEPPVQDEQDSIDQLDRELAGLDDFLNDVRGHTGGDL